MIVVHYVWCVPAAPGVRGRLRGGLRGARVRPRRGAAPARHAAGRAGAARRLAARARRRLLHRVLRVPPAAAATAGAAAAARGAEPVQARHDRTRGGDHVRKGITVHRGALERGKINNSGDAFFNIVVIQ